MAALQTVGACLVIAMVVTPGATAYLLTDRFGRLIGISRRARRVDQRSRRLSQLLSGRRHRRRHRHAADGSCFSRPSSSRPKHGVLGGAAAGHRHARPCQPRGGAMTALDWIMGDWLAGPLAYPFMQRALDRVADGRRGLRGPVLLSGAEGLVADGRRHLSCGAARHRHRPCGLGVPLVVGAFVSRTLLCAAHRLSEGEQPREGGHRDGHRVLRHVRASAWCCSPRWRPTSTSITFCSAMCSA